MDNKGEYFPPDLSTAREMSSELQRQIKAAQALGGACLKQARWIGLDKYIYILYSSIVIVLNRHF
jgi:hypothetical protein